MSSQQIGYQNNVTRNAELGKFKTFSVAYVTMPVKNNGEKGEKMKMNHGINLFPVFSQ